MPSVDSTSAVHTPWHSRTRLVALGTAALMQLAMLLALWTQHLEIPVDRAETWMDLLPVRPTVPRAQQPIAPHLSRQPTWRPSIARLPHCRRKPTHRPAVEPRQIRGRPRLLTQLRPRLPSTSARILCVVQLPRLPVQATLWLPRQEAPPACPRPSNATRRYTRVSVKAALHRWTSASERSLRST
jgi:hypothetical protein